MRQTALREQLSPPPRPARWQNLRLVEYLLRQHNIRCPLTLSEEKACPNWMQMGFSLYHKLEGLGYAPFPCENESLQWLEVYPHACFCALLGRTPFPKELLEGRLQRQLVLYDRDLHVPDPLRFFEEITRHRLLQGILPLDNLYTPGELDALVAAFTAWMAVNHPEQSLALGDAREGVIHLPVGELTSVTFYCYLLQIAICIWDHRPEFEHIEKLAIFPNSLLFQYNRASALYTDCQGSQPHQR